MQDLTKLEEKKQKILDQIIKTGNQSLEDDLHNYLGRIKDKIEKLEGLAEAAEKRLNIGRSNFLDFAMEFIDKLGQHFFELTLEEIEMCKKILFPGGFWVDLNKNIYTPEISPLYRERTTKMGPLNPENCPIVDQEVSILHNKSLEDRLRSVIQEVNEEIDYWYFLLELRYHQHLDRLNE